MLAEKLVALTRSILNQPTAPFHEEFVRAEIRRQLDKLPSVRLAEDNFGNLIATYQRGGHLPAFAFAAHMDHPGWVRHPQKSDEPMDFLGGVPEDYLATCEVENFSDGAFAMWKLPALDLRDGKIHSRACDDLIGCVAIVAMMHDLEEKQVDCTVLGLFTRAEEVGLVGAMKLAASSILPENITVISLETSPERLPARMGDGPIIRVGDKISVFDPRITAQLVAAAQTAGITFQRCLMAGGTCEATAYQVYDVRCGALCIALGNYHNCGLDGKIAAEFVSFSDFSGLVDLCTAAASQTTSGPETVQANLKRRLEQNADHFAAYFE
ncbi:MAG TPA: M20/M25/M40 family metallo-hydrolase [Chthoniobacterales bacterium]